MASTTTMCLAYKDKMLTAHPDLPSWSDPNWKIMVLSGALFNALTVQTINEVSANQVVTGTAYTGPILLPVITKTPSSNNLTIDWDDITIAQDAGGFTDGTHGAIFYDTGTPTTSVIALLWDFDKTTNNTVEPIELKTPNDVFRI